MGLWGALILPYLGAPWGLRTAKVLSLSWAPGRASVVTSYADSDSTSPSLGGCELRNCHHCRGSWGVQRGAALKAAQLKLASLGPWVGWQLRHRRHFRGLLGGPAERCLEGVATRPRSSLGAGNCETVATFVGSWGVQRSAVLKASQLSLACPRGAGNWASPPPSYLAQQKATLVMSSSITTWANCSGHLLQMGWVRRKVFLFVYPNQFSTTPWPRNGPRRPKLRKHLGD